MSTFTLDPLENQDPPFGVGRATVYRIERRMNRQDLRYLRISGRDAAMLGRGETRGQRRVHRAHFVCKSDSALNKILTEQSSRVAGVEAREPPSSPPPPPRLDFFHYLSRRHAPRILLADRPARSRQRQAPVVVVSPSSSGRDVPPRSLLNRRPRYLTANGFSLAEL